jgi:hypothetical protein
MTQIPAPLTDAAAMPQKQQQQQAAAAAMHGTSAGTLIQLLAL